MNDGALGALQGIQIGPALSDIAVSGDQLLHSRALATHFDVGAGLHHLGAALLGALGERIDHGQVRNILGVTAVAGRNMLERIKIAAPRVGHAAGIGEVVFVHLFDVRRIAPEEIGVA